MVAALSVLSAPIYIVARWREIPSPKVLRLAARIPLAEWVVGVLDGGRRGAEGVA